MSNLARLDKLSDTKQNLVRNFEAQATGLNAHLSDYELNKIAAMSDEQAANYLKSKMSSSVCPENRQQLQAIVA